MRIVAPHISDVLIEAARSSDRLHLDSREYSGPEDLIDAELVFAATDLPDLNAEVARHARRLHRLVNVASQGSEGSFVSMAVHSAGRVTIGVSAGGVPTAAMEIRDAIAERFDDLFTKDIEALAEERSRTIADGAL